jgi:chitinase
MSRCNSKLHQSDFSAVTVRSVLLSFFVVSIIVLLSPAVLSATKQTTQKPLIIAYVFTRNSLLQPGQIDANKLSRINYAFANIQDGHIVEGTPSDAANFAALNKLKRENPSLKILVSVGGWLWSGNFSDMSLTLASRQLFIKSVIAFLDRYELDGLDIDWEYPGMIGNGNRFRPEDKQNYTLLLREMRKSFDQQQTRLHRRLLLSIATGASSEFLANTEMAKVQSYVDTVNLMAYDYYEPGSDKISGNHAPLFTDPADPKKISADVSIREYERAGVPAGKLVLGVPFYGHVWGEVPAANHGLFQAGIAVPNAYSGYGAIVTNYLNHGYTRFWDAQASVPYLYSDEKQIFVTYEDPESLSIKSKYVLDHRLAGVMFWDYSSDPTGALLDSLNTSLRRRGKSSGKPQ